MPITDLSQTSHQVREGPIGDINSISPSECSRQRSKRERDALSASNAQGDDPALDLVALHGMQDARRQTRPRAPKRRADRNGAEI
jgi:hypothetical protein